jgi:hypothetical protein
MNSEQFHEFLLGLAVGVLIVAPLMAFGLAAALVRVLPSRSKTAGDASPSSYNRGAGGASSPAPFAKPRQEP